MFAARFYVCYWVTVDTGNIGAGTKLASDTKDRGWSPAYSDTKLSSKLMIELVIESNNIQNECWSDVLP